MYFSATDLGWRILCKIHTLPHTHVCIRAHIHMFTRAHTHAQIELTHTHAHALKDKCTRNLMHAKNTHM